MDQESYELYNIKFLKYSIMLRTVIRYSCHVNAKPGKYHHAGNDQREKKKRSIQIPVTG